MGDVDLNQVMNSEPPEIAKPVKKTRIELVTEMLTNYPLEKFKDWYLTNHPDIYAAYVFAKEEFSPKKETVKQKARISLKLLIILLAIIGVAAVIVFFVMTNFLNEIIMKKTSNEELLGSFSVKVSIRG